jgi:Zn-dependent M28 family amino/carboxypeptidase
LANIGVDIVFFDGEEFGRPGSQDYCAGSKYFAAHLSSSYPESPPVAVIILDMVGDADLSFPPERSSAVKARALTSLIWSEGVRLGLPAFINGLGRELGPKPPPISRWIVDDHSPFQALNIPATLIIDLDYPYWHTHQDTLDKVSASSLKQTGDVLVASLRKLDQLMQ